jgi:hypothetical protein
VLVGGGFERFGMFCVFRNYIAVAMLGGSTGRVSTAALQDGAIEGQDSEAEAVSEGSLELSPLESRGYPARLMRGGRLSRGVRQEHAYCPPCGHARRPASSRRKLEQNASSKCAVLS